MVEKLIACRNVWFVESKKKAHKSNSESDIRKLILTREEKKKTTTTTNNPNKFNIIINNIGPCSE